MSREVDDECKPVDGSYGEGNYIKAWEEFLEQQGKKCHLIEECCRQNAHDLLQTQHQLYASIIKDKEKALQDFKNEMFKFFRNAYKEINSIQYNLSRKDECCKMEGMYDLGFLHCDLCQFMDKHFPEHHALED